MAARSCRRSPPTSRRSSLLTPRQLRTIDAADAGRRRRSRPVRAGRPRLAPVASPSRRAPARRSRMPATRPSPKRPASLTEALARLLPIDRGRRAPARRDDQPRRRPHDHPARPVSPARRRRRGARRVRAPLRRGAPAARRARRPGLRSTRVQRVAEALGGETDLVLVTAMDFDDRAALDAGLASDAMRPPGGTCARSRPGLATLLVLEDAPDDLGRAATDGRQRGSPPSADTSDTGRGTEARDHRESPRRPTSSRRPASSASTPPSRRPSTASRS